MVFGVYRRNKTRKYHYKRLFFSSGVINLVGDWGIINSLKYICRTVCRNERQRIHNGVSHINLRMDGRAYADNCRRIFYTGIS